ncbi:hypothetical protein DKG74_04305 [Zavarzinia aquatilis]|uniref:Uncharacterized protein n=1 Tax=Zavarzinia aquatilis TaxID=2211142 RepID=A0A317ED85_9PROT|nr:hypothetical protein DKG74_04305 [Zavarzinia aquatilis]
MAMPPQAIMQGIPIFIMFIICSQQVLNIAMSMPAIGSILHIMPCGVISQVILHIIIGIIMGIMPFIICGIMPFIMPIIGIWGICIIGIMPFIIWGICIIGAVIMIVSFWLYRRSAPASPSD